MPQKLCPSDSEGNHAALLLTDERKIVTYKCHNFGKCSRETRLLRCNSTSHIPDFVAIGYSEVLDFPNTNNTSTTQLLVLCGASQYLRRGGGRLSPQAKSRSEVEGSLAAQDSTEALAEGEGFEPPVPLRAQRFSRPPVSTAHTSLRGGRPLNCVHCTTRPSQLNPPAGQASAPPFTM